MPPTPSVGTCRLRIGFHTNLLNPKAVLFFLALFTSLVSIHTPGEVKAVYVVSMSILLFAWFALVSVFFTTLRCDRAFSESAGGLIG